MQAPMENTIVGRERSSSNLPPLQLVVGAGLENSRLFATRSQCFAMPGHRLGVSLPQLAKAHRKHSIRQVVRLGVPVAGSDRPIIAQTFLALHLIAIAGLRVENWCEPVCELDVFRPTAKRQSWRSAESR